MPISSIPSHPKVKASDIPLEKLEGSKALTQEEKTAEATRQFESLLLRQILTEAQKPVFQSKFAMSGVASSIYKDMNVTQLADTISSSRTVGLAQELQKQLSRERAPKPISQENHSQPKPAGPPQILTKAPR